MMTLPLFLQQFQLAQFKIYMKKTIYFLLAGLLMMSASCNSQKKSTGDNSSESKVITYQVNTSFILLPIEEKAPEVQVNVRVASQKFNETYNVRLAQNKTDYWMPLKVSKFKAKELTLTFSNYKGSEQGISDIKESEKFDFDYDETYRPQFHFTPEYGWMNDPNGMVYQNGEYHLFYQYNPFGCVWGNMSWGHAVSKNLTDWKHLPVVLTPDSLGDIFSGSAVVDKENSAGFGKNAMIAFYTSAGNVQSQSIAYSTDNGRTFTKYAHNPVIKNPGIVDFRDPKVFWHKESSQWIMTLATKQTVTFYGSKNLKEWTKLSEFGEGIGCHGGVWECPDLIYFPPEGEKKEAGTWVLIVNINPGGPNGGSAGQYFIGNFDGKTFTPDNLPYPLWMDYGRDNYAGVTWNNIPETDGRHILLGWMNNWDYANQIPTKNFRSSNTVARELSLKNNGKHLVVANYPVKEILSKFKEPASKQSIRVSKEVTLNNFIKNNNGAYKIEMTVVPQNASQFGFCLFNSKHELLDFSFDISKEKLSINRDKSGITDFNDKFKGIATAPLVKKQEYKITLLVDKSSAELFINKGELAMTTLFFPSEAMNNLKFYSSEKIAVKDISFCPLR